MSRAARATPDGTPARWFGEYTAGEIFETPDATLTADDILEFARRYDPQYFHLDREAAESSIFGGLIASGWQIGAVSFGLVVRSGFLGRASHGSPGCEVLKWLKPVRPGDTIRVVITILETRESRSRPDIGYVRVRYDVLNQDGETVMTYTATQIVGRRENGDTESGQRQDPIMKNREPEENPC